MANSVNMGTRGPQFIVIMGTRGNRGVDKKLVATEGDVVDCKFRLLYSAPEAIVSSVQWKQLLLVPPLSKCVVAVAVDEAHCVYKW